MHMRWFTLICTLLPHLAWAQGATIATPAPWQSFGLTGTLSVSSTSDRVLVDGIAGANPLPLSIKACNTGSVALFAKAGNSAVTATTATGTLIAPGICVPLAIPANATYVAAVTTASTTTLSVQAGTGTIVAGVPGAGGGGSCASLGGDVTGTCTANTVSKIDAVPILATGTGFTIITQNLAADGNLAIGEEQTRAGYTGVEGTFGGDRAGGAFNGAANANTAWGHNSCGISWASVTGVVATVPTGSYNSCFGNDAGRDIWGAASGNTIAGQHAGTAVGGNNNSIYGSGAGGLDDVGTTYANISLFGYQVGTTTLNSGTHVLLAGTSSSCDTPAPGSSNMIILCAGGGAVISATGTDTPLTSTVTDAGALAVNGGAGAVTVATNQAQASGGTTLLPFASTSGLSVGQLLSVQSSASIPFGDTIASIVSTSQVTLTGNGVSNSGQKIVTTTATAGTAVGQQCTDTTTPTAIGAGNVIASIQAGVSITMTSNLVASTGASDSITCNPVVTLAKATTAAIASGTSIVFLTNHSAPSTASSSYVNGDVTVSGNLLTGRSIVSANGATNSLLIGNDTGNSAFSMIGFDGGLNDQNNAGIIGGANADLYFNVNTGQTYHWKVRTDVMTLTSTALSLLNSLNLSVGGAVTVTGSNANTNISPTGTSTVTLGPPAGQLVFANLSTGTNADTLCLSAGGVVLIQAAACTISSLRFKNVRGDYFAGLDTIRRLDPIVFTMKPGEKANADWNYDKPQIGLSAENVAAIEPRCAIYEQDGRTPKSYRQECLIAVLVAAVKEQQQQIAELRRVR